MNKSLLTCPPPPPIDEGEHFIMDQTFRIQSPPTSLEKLINYASEQRDIDRLIGQLHSNET